MSNFIAFFPNMFSTIFLLKYLKIKIELLVALSFPVELAAITGYFFVQIRILGFASFW